MRLEVFLLYLATWSLLAVTPGPAVICATTQAARYGWRHALAGILGIQMGHVVFFGCTACGLAALLAAATSVFTVLRIAGAAYLIYLGLRMILSTLRARGDSQSAPVPPARRSLLWQGFGIQVTNPKALLFMSAFLPQFIDPDRSLPLQLSVLFLATIAVDTVVLSAYAAFAVRSARALKTGRTMDWLERCLGAAFVLFGFRLLAWRK
jgi:threonine/homoserine/homoserine lactone efflux protein